MHLVLLSASSTDCFGFDSVSKAVLCYQQAIQHLRLSCNHRCKACRASLDAVRTALARPTNAAARPVGALALEVGHHWRQLKGWCILHAGFWLESVCLSSVTKGICLSRAACLLSRPALVLLQRATRSSEPFMRSTAALITQSGRSSCRRASEPVHAQPAGRSAPCVSTPSNKGGSAMQVALSSIRCVQPGRRTLHRCHDCAPKSVQTTCGTSRMPSIVSPPWSNREDPAGQMYQAAAHSAAAAAAMMPPPAWNGAQHRRPAPPPPPFYHHVPQQPRSRLGGYTQPQTAARTSSTRVQAPMAAMPPPALEASKGEHL